MPSECCVIAYVALGWKSLETPALTLWELGYDVFVL